MTGAADKIALDSQSLHVEDDGDLKVHNEVVLKSSLDNLGLWATIKRFKKVSSTPSFSPLNMRLTIPRLSLSAI